MDIEAARAELAHALACSPPTGSRFRAAHQVLVSRGIECLGLAPGPGLTIAEVLHAAIDAPPTEARRAFAVLLVHALGIPDLLPTRGQGASDIRSFLERALLNPLRRAGYPFDGTAYDKRQALARLHATIDEHLRPLEPTMPSWLQGLRRE
jgi:hypothetical protein